MLLEKRGFSIVTIVLVFNLGPIIEYNVRVGLAYSNGEWSVFVGTWPRVILTSLIAFFIGKEIKAAVVVAQPKARLKLSPTKAELEKPNHA